MKHALCFLFISAFSLQAFSQQIGDTIKVELNRHIGPGPFQQSMSLFRANPTDESERYFNLHEKTKGLPDQYSELEVGSLPSDFRQMAFSAIKRGILDSANYYGGWFSDDSPAELAELTSEYIDTEVSIAYGQIEERHILIIDKNNNEDFSDDEVIELNADELNMKAFSSPSIYSAMVERYSGKGAVKDSVYFAFLPLEQMGRIYMSPSHHRSGSFMHNGKEHFVYVNNSFYGIQYTPATLKLIYSDKEHTQEDIRPSMDSYLSHKDFIQGEYFDYQIAGIDLGGQVLKLVIDEKKDRKGTSIGQIAPDVTGIQLDGNPFKVEAGTTTLLDFWGTWCGPCIAEIPYLQDAYELFKEEGFQIVSIANDNKDAVESFLEKNSMPWIHMMEKEAGSANSDYRIRGYPTTFLLANDMRIVEKQTSLRSVRLIQTLATHFDLSMDEVQNRINKGNVVLRFLGENLSGIMVESSFTNGQSRVYSLTGSSGNWERGYDVEPGEYELKVKVLKSGTAESEEITHSIKVDPRQDQQIIEIDLGKQ